MNKVHHISVGKALAWIFGYFLVVILYTALNNLVWRKIATSYSEWLNLVTMVVFAIVFLYRLTSKTTYRIRLFENFSAKWFVISVLCSILFYLLLDKGLDPMLERLFPASQEAYQNSIKRLSHSLVTTFIQVCFFAPMIEELLIRDFLLGGLKNKYGAFVALVISSCLFALMHFNMVQTLSALVGGLILGLLYLKTRSILCCILVHFGYNLISYITVIVPAI